MSLERLCPDSGWFTAVCRVSSGRELVLYSLFPLQCIHWGSTWNRGQSFLSLETAG